MPFSRFPAKPPLHGDSKGCRVISFDDRADVVTPSPPGRGKGEGEDHLRQGKVRVCSQEAPARAKRAGGGVRACQTTDSRNIFSLRARRPAPLDGGSGGLAKRTRNARCRPKGSLRNATQPRPRFTHGGVGVPGGGGTCGPSATSRTAPPRHAHPRPQGGRPPSIGVYGARGRLDREPDKPTAPAQAGKPNGR